MFAFKVGCCQNRSHAEVRKMLVRVLDMYVVRDFFSSRWHFNFVSLKARRDVQSLVAVLL